MELDFIETSRVHYKGKIYDIDKYIDRKSGKLYLQDRKTKEKIFLDHALGEEVTEEK